MENNLTYPTNMRSYWGDNALLLPLGEKIPIPEEGKAACKYTELFRLSLNLQYAYCNNGYYSLVERASDFSFYQGLVLSEYGQELFSQLWSLPVPDHLLKPIHTHLLEADEEEYDQGVELFTQLIDYAIIHYLIQTNGKI